MHDKVPAVVIAKVHEASRHELQGTGVIFYLAALVPESAAIYEIRSLQDICRRWLSCFIVRVRVLQKIARDARTF